MWKLKRSEDLVATTSIRVNNQLSKSWLPQSSNREGPMTWSRSMRASLSLWAKCRRTASRQAQGDPPSLIQASGLRTASIHHSWAIFQLLPKLVSLTMDRLPQQLIWHLSNTKTNLTTTTTLVEQRTACLQVRSLMWAINFSRLKSSTRKVVWLSSSTIQ